MIAGISFCISLFFGGIVVFLSINHDPWGGSESLFDRKITEFIAIEVLAIYAPCLNSPGKKEFSPQIGFFAYLH
jgi:hypothetical protein